MSLPLDSASFDPAATSQLSVADGNRLSAVYDALVATDPATGTVRPKIAESLTSNDGGKKWTLRIRPDVRFSDGTAYDAAAVKANWLRHQNPATGSQQLAGVAAITNLETIPSDPLTLVVTLKSPNANFDRIVARGLSYNASPKVLAENPGSLREHPVGAGPFLLKEWIQGQRQVFVRNPDYWQKDKGLPYLDELVVTVDSDLTHSIENVNDGSDLTATVDPEAIALGRARGQSVTDLRLNGGAMVVFNTARGPFADPRTRRAVALAMSSSEINEKFFGGAATPAQGIFSSTSLVSNIQLKAPENQPEEAARLFDAVTDNGKNPVTFEFIGVFAPKTLAIAQYVQEKLSAYRGVHVNLTKYDISAFIATMTKNSPKWDGAWIQQWFDDPEPGLYESLYSTSPLNISGYANPDVDKAFDDGRLAGSAQSRRTAYTRVQVSLNEDLPIWVYQEAVFATVASSKVVGLKLFNDGVVHWEHVGLRR